ncbi:inverted repeat binding protein 18 kDa isoform X1 [Temnothorax americanus]|uniref:inverted repeat binding protein 18 kDa isoform X1 n=1 Tax=Temnothorax americanus TaxID=1964332 RepID=UPI0040691BE0
MRDVRRGASFAQPRYVRWRRKIKKTVNERSKWRTRATRIIERGGIGITRVKSKLRTQQTLERVTQLKTENELLEEKIKMLTKELGFLKNLFIAHSGGSSRDTEAVNIQDLDLTALLADENATEASPKTGSAEP